MTEIVTPAKTFEGGETVKVEFTVAKLHADTNVVQLTRPVWYFNHPLGEPQAATVIFAIAGSDCTVVPPEEVQPITEASNA